jgi:hypothetical protein
MVVLHDVITSSIKHETPLPCCAKEMHAGVAQRWDVDTIKIGRILKIWFHSFGFWLRRYTLFYI